jgi:hypothetical protein
VDGALQTPHNRCAMAMDIAHIGWMALGQAQNHCFDQSLLDR